MFPEFEKYSLYPKSKGTITSSNTIVMKEETSVEWLFKQLWDEPRDKFTWNAILSKAEEMEKEQRKAVYERAIANYGIPPLETKNK